MLPSFSRAEHIFARIDLLTATEASENLWLPWRTPCERTYSKSPSRSAVCSGCSRAPCRLAERSANRRWLQGGGSR